MATHEEQIGNITLRWQAAKDGGFSGITILGGKRSEILHDADEERLKARLRNQAGTRHPNYFGMDGAIARFLKFMPGGFKGDHNIEMERDYKIAAHKALVGALALDAAANATNEQAKALLKAKIWTNLLSPFETMRLRDALSGPNGGAFVRAAAKFAAGNHAAGGTGMTTAIKPHGNISWPISTYLPFLWAPDRCMFLKPVVTVDYASRIGHRFQYDYKSTVESSVYASLLDLVEFTHRHIADLAPHDLIDVQSFIWVVGAYTDEDLPK